MESIFLEINWKDLLLGEEKWPFIGEIAIRSVVMFLIILLTLRLLGKRGIKQLSVFELGVIVGLGSAAGDPMFYNQVGLLAGLAVFATVIGLYKLVTFLISRSEKFEHFVEGKPAYVVKEGRIVIENFSREAIARDELFMQLRLHQISHLGQVELAILEINGEISVYFYADEEIRPGLPILPDDFKPMPAPVENYGPFSCSRCGDTKMMLPSTDPACSHCHNRKWVKAMDKKRIS